MTDDHQKGHVGAGFTPARQERFPVRRKIRLPLSEYQQGHLFFITIGTHERYKWFQLYPDLADAVVTTMKNLAKERESILFAWCTMPDHLHLLVQDRNLVEFMRLLKGRMTPHARKLEASRRLWQRSFYDHALRKEESVYQVTMYIWENPVRAGLVEEPCEYRWSGSEVWSDLEEYYGHWR